ncbi:MAG TPA: BamA/TamA family outer membrane protein [Allosphingosinicella sp.]|nr:BamA/TamA family outer membrane protein [Allosphingosinicella sp.]
MILKAAVAGGAVAWACSLHAQTPPPPPPKAPPPDQAADQGPIVRDSQFQKALPPLDSEIGKPLAPLGMVVPPAAGPSAPATPTIPVATPNGQLPPSNVPTDPELTQPLTPLSSFDLTPPRPTAANQKADESAPEPVRYQLLTEGFDKVGLDGRFHSLSALAEADGKATNGSQVRARAKEDEQLAVRLLRSEGYYDATAVATVEQLPNQPGQLRVTVAAVPGARYNFGQIVVTGTQTVPPDLARTALPLKTGDPIVAANVEAGEANIRLRLPEQGYPFVDVGMRDVLLDPATHVGDYTLPVDPGPRSLFAGFTTRGKLAFDAKHVGVLARFKRGELYDSRKVDDLREAMVATNLFRTVAATPVRTGQFAPDGSEYVNVDVRQVAGPSHSLSGTAGYATGEGFKVQGTWEALNMFPPEGALIVTGVAGTQDQGLQVAFRRNNAGQRDRTFLLQVQADRQRFPAYHGYLARLYGLMSRESTPIWQKVWTYSYGAEIVASNENENRFPPISITNAHFIAGLIGELGYDRSNSLLDPTKGFRLRARVNPEASLRKPTKPYLRDILEGSVYYPVAKDITIAARSRVGSIYGISVAELPPSRRLYAGGGGSVRGFGYQELGPKDAKGNPIGGRSLVEFSLEARYRFGNYGIVPFIDAGNVYETQYPELSGMRYGVGIGGRLYTNFGPLRLDVATPIARRKGESRVAIYVSIGQAF